jgi:hypothetical protein
LIFQAFLRFRGFGGKSKEKRKEIKTFISKLSFQFSCLIHFHFSILEISAIPPTKVASASFGFGHKDGSCSP